MTNNDHSTSLLSAYFNFQSMSVTAIGTGTGYPFQYPLPGYLK